jgi:hypothetical protein
MVFDVGINDFYDVGNMVYDCGLLFCMDVGNNGVKIFASMKVWRVQYGV